jgi:PmbA protein
VDLKSLAEKLLGLIERSRADAGEVFLEHTEGVDIEVRDQAVERLKNTDASGYGLRLIVDKRMAFVSSSDLRDESLERTIHQGVELAVHSAADESNVLAPPSEEELVVNNFDEGIDGIGIDRKVNLLKDTETLCFAYDPAISKMEGLNYTDRKTETVIGNTEGLLSHRHSTYFEIGAGVVAERDGDVENAWEGMESRFFDELDPPSKLASSACRKAIMRLGGGPVETQDVPVIFDRETAYAVLIHFFQMVNGDRIASGVSMLKHRLGEKIGSGLVTIIDDPTLSGKPASRPFDDEGIPSERTVVLDGGVLESFLFDLKTGAKAGYKSTGNASRAGFRALPGVASTNFYLAEGDRSHDEIIAETPRGFHVTSLAGWWVGINPATGDFSSGAKGFWIENGEAVRPVKNVTIASNIIAMLTGVDAVANNLYYRHATVGPSFRISEMRVGGI